jgi:anti-sigma28 factor (negative regulator of flagellin synthesis)
MISRVMDEKPSDTGSSPGAAATRTAEQRDGDVERQARVDQIAEAYAAGAYKVDPEAVASKIIDDALDHGARTGGLPKVNPDS